MNRFEWRLRTSLAAQLGASPSTVSRDLRYPLFGGTEHTCRNCEGELLFGVSREYPGGSVVEVTDAQYRPIRGQERRRILRHVRRYPR